MPVWRVQSDYGDGAEVFWAFVAAPDRATARGFGDPYGDGEARVSVAAVREDGIIGTHKPQATVEAETPYELDAQEIFALGWVQDETGSYRVGSKEAAEHGYGEGWRPQCGY